MSVKVRVEDDCFQITIPVKEAYKSKPIRNLLAILRAQETLARSMATEEQIAQLADEVTAGWWKANKEWFLNESSA